MRLSLVKTNLITGFILSTVVATQAKANAAEETEKDEDAEDGYANINRGKI